MTIKLSILAVIAISGALFSLYGIGCLSLYSSMSIASYALIALFFVDIILCWLWGTFVYWCYDYLLYVYSFVNELFVYLSEVIIFKYRFLRYCVISILISMDLAILINVCYFNIYYFDILGLDYIFSKLFVFCVILAMVLYLSFFCKPLDHLMLVPKAQMPINNYLGFLKCAGWFVLIRCCIASFSCIVNIMAWAWGYVCGECLPIIISFLGGVHGGDFEIGAYSWCLIMLGYIVLVCALFYCLRGIAVSYYDFEVYKRYNNFWKDRLIYRTFIKNCLLIYSLLMCFVVSFVACVIFPTVNVVYQILLLFAFVLKIILLYRVYVYKKEAIQA